MKTLAREGDKSEIVRRLGLVRPDSVRRWGRMSAHQMVCHLGDAFRMVLGQKPARDASSLLSRTIVKWVALFVPVRWPSGIMTTPEIDQNSGGTPPAEFADDLAQLHALLARFTALQEWPSHPTMGRMSEDDWLRWGYLHMDHHLRQFGV